jgi:hypothetical protein
MLGPHLTPENHVEVLGRAKFRTKKEIAKLLRELSPLPPVPDLVQPLRPEPPPLATTRPSWEHFVSSFEPLVGSYAPESAREDGPTTTMRPDSKPEERRPPEARRLPATAGGRRGSADFRARCRAPAASAR